MSEELKERVTAVVQETIADSTGRDVSLTSDSALISSGELDSLTVLQLFVALQNEFDVELDVDDITEATFETPATIAELIAERID